MEKIAEIIDPTFRTGIGKKGTPWTLMKIKTDSGKEASMFAPAAIGDPVNISFNEQYKNYSAELLTAKKMEIVVEKEKQDDKLNDIIEKLDIIIDILNKQKNEKAFDEEEVNLDDVPF